MGREPEDERRRRLMITHFGTCADASFGTRKDGNG